MKKKNLFQFFTSVLITILLMMSISVYFIIQQLNSNLDTLKSSIETEYRENIRLELATYTTRTEQDINNLIKEGKINNLNKNVFTKHLDSLSYNGGIENISVFNIGYTMSRNIPSEVNKIHQKYNQLSESKLSDCIETLYVAFYEDNLQWDDFRQLVNTEINSLTEGLKVDKTKLTEDVYKILFNKNEIVFSTNDMYPEQDTMLDTFKTKDSWVEWVTIPKGFLGVNNETAYEDGEANLKYKKYAVVVSIDKNFVLAKYYKMVDQTDNIKILLLFVLVCCTITAIVISTIRFYKIMNGGGVVEPINRKTTNSDNDAYYELSSRIYDKFKSLRRR